MRERGSRGGADPYYDNPRLRSGRGGGVMLFWGLLLQWLWVVRASDFPVSFAALIISCCFNFAM